MNTAVSVIIDAAEADASDLRPKADDAFARYMGAQVSFIAMYKARWAARMEAETV